MLHLFGPFLKHIGVNSIYGKFPEKGLTQTK